METDPTRMCALLVGLPSVVVRGVGEWPSWLRVEVETRWSRPDCAGCGTVAWDHGQREVLLVDLPVFGRPARLAWRKQRWRCPNVSCVVVTWSEQDSWQDDVGEAEVVSAWSQNGGIHLQGFDVLVVGGGIAGVSVSYELSDGQSVCLLEMEPTLAYHTTGRSAATFLESYGGSIIRRLTLSSRSFFNDPPEGFDGPLMTSRPLLWLGPTGTGDQIRNLHQEVSPLVPSVYLVKPDDAVEIHPLLREDFLELCMLEPEAMELDVSALHQGYVRGMRRRGGEIHTSSAGVGLSRVDNLWEATTRDGQVYAAPVVVNASGAWGDEVAKLAGVAPVGLHPLRRTIFMVNSPDGLDISQFPLTGDIGATFYMKPEGPQFLCSPADETLSAPCDAKVEEIDVARAIERIREATILEAEHVRSSWAGLRTFTHDRSPIACFEPTHEGFFWLVGQGGYGIQTAPALARVAANLVKGVAMPADLSERGLEADHLHRERLAGLTELTDH